MNQGFINSERLPCVISPDADCEEKVNLCAFVRWIRANRSQIHRDLLHHGALMFRGFPLSGISDLRKVMLALNPDVVEYTGAKARNEIDDEGRIYSPTSTPAYLKNFLHNEMAYQPNIPSKMILYCDYPSEVGGETLLGDMRNVYRSIDPEVRREFERRKLKFVRFMIDEGGLSRFLARRSSLFALTPSWQSNLGTRDRAEAERRCRERSLEVEWTERGHLKLSCIIPPVRNHPLTEEQLWVNNAHLFQLNERVYGKLLSAMAKMYFLATKREMTSCYYGDTGTPIQEEFINNILDAVEENSIVLRLEAGDFIYIDNYRVSHGRLPFRGKRRLMFALYE